LTRHPVDPIVRLVRQQQLPSPIDRRWIMHTEELRARVAGLGLGISRRRAVGRLVGGLAGLAAGAATLQAAAQESTPGIHATPVIGIQPTLVGSWIVTVSFDGTPPLTLPNLVTYAADGTLTVAAPPRLPELPDSGLQTDYFSGGHGVWTETAVGAELRFAFLVSDETGALASINTIRATVAIDSAGDAYTGNFTLHVVDPGGTSTNSAGTLTGARITIDDSAPVQMPAV
jgi:hypothetical protein